MTQEYVPLTYHYWKRSNKKRKKLPPIKTIQNKLELITRILIRRNYGNECYTCGQKNLKGVNWHTGHMIPKSVCGVFLKWDLRNMRPQCFSCNIDKGGNGAIFKKRMEEREGIRYVNGIFNDLNRFIKEREHYPSLLKKYEGML